MRINNEITQIYTCNIDGVPLKLSYCLNNKTNWYENKSINRCDIKSDDTIILREKKKTKIE